MRTCYARCVCDTTPRQARWGHSARWARLASKKAHQPYCISHSGVPLCENRVPVRISEFSEFLATRALCGPRIRRHMAEKQNDGHVLGRGVSHHRRVAAHPLQRPLGCGAALARTHIVHERSARCKQTRAASGDRNAPRCPTFTALVTGAR